MFMSGHANEWWVIAVLVLFAGLIMYALLKSSRTEKSKTLLAFTGVLVISVLSVVLQNLFLDTPFPYARTGLFLFVLFVFALAESLRDTMIPRFVSLSLCIAAISFQLFYAIPAFNLRHTLEWQYCEDVEVALNDLMQDEYQPDSLHVGITVATDLQYGNILSYYLRLKNIQNVTLVSCEHLEQTDYYIVSRLAPHEIPHCDTIRNYTGSGLMLLKNNTVPAMSFQRGGASIANGLCTLIAPKDQCLLSTNIANVNDSGLARLNVSTTITFPQSTSAGVLLIWHYHDGKDIWSSWEPYDAPEKGLERRIVVSRILPKQVMNGDEIKVFLIPYKDPGGPMTVSGVTSELWVEKPSVTEEPVNEIP
jgi:hypothetical protein